LYYNNNTLKYEGELIGGEPNGWGKSYNYDGDVVYEGEWKNGKYHGLGRVVFKHRSPLAGIWE
jgi:hypothetical protein